MQLTLKIPDEISAGLDALVDGLRYRSRAQLITVILAEWLTNQGIELRLGKKKGKEKK